MRFGETAKKILGLEPIPAYDEQLRQQAKLLGKGQSLEAPLGGIEDHLVAMPSGVVDFSLDQRAAEIDDNDTSLIDLEQRAKRAAASLPKSFFKDHGVITTRVVSTTEYPETLAARLSETISNRREIGSYTVNPSSLHGHFEPEHRVTRPITGERVPRLPLQGAEDEPTYYLDPRGFIGQLVTNDSRGRTDPKAPYTKVYESELDQLPGGRDRESVYVGRVGRVGDLDDDQRRMLVVPLRAIVKLAEQLEQSETRRPDTTSDGPIRL